MQLHSPNTTNPKKREENFDLSFMRSFY